MGSYVSIRYLHESSAENFALRRFGQSCELHALTALGCEMALATDATTFPAEVAEVKPTILLAVPALYNRIYDGFQKTKSAMPSWKAKLADRALALGDKKARSRLVDGSGMPVGPQLNLLERAELAVLDGAILSKVRERLGGQVRAVASGGAAISNDVRGFFDAVGIAVTNGYGLTETSPVLSSENILDSENRLPGSIGVSLPSVLLKVIGEDGRETRRGEPGELVASTPGLMRGYWNQPDATASAVFADSSGTRWFRTGDQGIILESGHIRIVGRIKEKYKLANGKYVVPTPIEEAFARSRFISQVFLYGDNRAYNVALVAPDWSAVDEAVTGCATSSIAQHRPFDFGPQELIDELITTHRDAIVNLIRSELEAHNTCKSYEFPTKWTIVTQGFTVARSMLTPKLSLRRNNVYKEHEADIDALYAESQQLEDAALPRIIVSSVSSAKDTKIASAAMSSASQ